MHFFFLFLPPAAYCLRSHLIELFAASSVSPLIGYLLTLLCAARHIRLICHYFAIMNFFFSFLNNNPNFAGWRSDRNWILRAMCLCCDCAHWRIGSGNGSHLSVSLSLSFSLTHSYSSSVYLFPTHRPKHAASVCVCACVAAYAAGLRWCVFLRGCRVHVWREMFCVRVCVHLRRIVWTGKMRMDGIVITEWRYPHSVKLEKAGRKPPTGTAATDGVVVMAIGGGFANLLGERCERCRLELL